RYVQMPVAILRLISPSLFVSHVFIVSHTATSEIYPLSLHDALPIWGASAGLARWPAPHRHGSTLLEAPAYPPPIPECRHRHSGIDRKSTRLNSSHEWISYAVFCLKKKNTS